MKSARIAAAVEEFKDAFPNVRPFFATKCNTDPGVLRVLHTAGARFEVASVDEVGILRSLGVRGQDLLFSNPVRAREQTRGAARAGVYRFSVDSLDELERVAEEAPGSCVYARLSTGDRASLVPSEGKFGVDVPGAIELLVRARTLGLVPYGITFHIGSQSLTPAALTGPLEDVHTVLARLVSHGIRLQMVDIGGGFPAVYDEPVPSLAAFGRAAAAGIAQLPYPVEVFAEPGRCLVAEAGTFRCRVIGVARRPCSSPAGSCVTRSGTRAARRPGEAGTSPAPPATARTRTPGTYPCRRTCGRVTSCSSVPPVPTRPCTRPVSTASPSRTWC
jgi:ornithine decarboxylase